MSVPIQDTIVPKNNGNFPVVMTTNVGGARQIVATFSALASLPSGILVAGMEAFAADTKITYILGSDLETWTESPVDYGVAANTIAIATNAANIAANTSSIATNTSNNAANTAAITSNAASIATNTSNIATNTANIATNTTAIASNATAIAAATTATTANAAAITAETTRAETVEAKKQAIFNVTQQTANYTANPWDFVEANASSGPLSVTLGNGTIPGQTIVLKKMDSSTNSVSLVGVIDGATNPSIKYQYGSIEVVWDGTIWVRSVRPSLGALVDYPATTDARYAQLSAVVPLIGGVTVSGDVVFSNGLQSSVAPVNPTDVARLSDLTAVASGYNTLNSVQSANSAALPAFTYSSGVMTASANGVFPTATNDGILPVVGRRFCYWDYTQAGGSSPYYGIYVWTSIGSSSAPWVATRSSDASTAAQLGAAKTYVAGGTANAGLTLYVNESSSAITSGGGVGTTSLPIIVIDGSGAIAAEAAARVLGDQNTLKTVTTSLTNILNYTGSDTIQPLVVDVNNQTLLGANKSTGYMSIKLSPNDPNVAAGIQSQVTKYTLSLLSYSGGGNYTPLYVDVNNNLLLGFNNTTGALTGSSIAGLGGGDSGTTSYFPLPTQNLPILKAVNGTIAYGQSLSNGTYGQPALSITPYYSNLTFAGGAKTAKAGNLFGGIVTASSYGIGLAASQPLVEDNNQASDGSLISGETVCTGLANQAVTYAIVQDDYTPSEFVIFASEAGHGSYSIAQLSPLTYTATGNGSTATYTYYTDTSSGNTRGAAVMSVTLNGTVVSPSTYTTSTSGSAPSVAYNVVFNTDPGNGVAIEVFYRYLAVATAQSTYSATGNGTTTTYTYYTDTSAANTSGSTNVTVLVNGTVVSPLTYTLPTSGSAPSVAYEVTFNTAPVSGAAIQVEYNTVSVNWYQNFIDHVTAAYALSPGGSYACHTLNFFDGEQDCAIGTSQTAFYNALTALQVNSQAIVQSVTGQTSPLHVLMYMTELRCTGITTPATGYVPGAILAAEQAIIQNNPLFHLATPIYHLPIDPGQTSHLSNLGYRWLGAYFGRAYKQLVIDGRKPDCIWPISAVMRESVLYVKFTVPTLPLVIDVSTLAATLNDGFVVQTQKNYTATGNGSTTTYTYYTDTSSGNTSPGKPISVTVAGVVVASSTYTLSTSGSAPSVAYNVVFTTAPASGAAIDVYYAVPRSLSNIQVVNNDTVQLTISGNYDPALFVRYALDNQGTGLTASFAASGNLRDSTTDTISLLNSTAGFVGSISGTTLTITSSIIGGGSVQALQTLVGTGVTPNTQIVSGSGSSWTVSPSQTVASTNMASGILVTKPLYHVCPHFILPITNLDPST